MLNKVRKTLFLIGLILIILGWGSCIKVWYFTPVDPGGHSLLGIMVLCLVLCLTGVHFIVLAGILTFLKQILEEDNV